MTDKRVFKPLRFRMSLREMDKRSNQNSIFAFERFEGCLESRLISDQSKMADTTETLWFKIIVTIASGFFAGLFLANIIYYNRLRTGGTLSSGEITSMLWLNAILFVVAIIIFIWALVRLVLSPSSRDVVQTKAVTVLQSTDTGFDIPGAKKTTTTTTVAQPAVPAVKRTTTTTTVAQPTAPAVRTTTTTVQRRPTVVVAPPVTQVVQ